MPSCWYAGAVLERLPGLIEDLQTLPVAQSVAQMMCRLFLESHAQSIFQMHEQLVEMILIGANVIGVNRVSIACVR